MSKFQITSKAGADFGVYGGATAEEAFAAMVADGGSSDGAEGTAADWHITEVVTIGDWTGPMDVARNLMDDDLCEAIHGKVGDEQAFADAYVAAHAAKFGGEQFTVA